MDQRNIEIFPKVVKPNCSTEKILKRQKTLVADERSGIGKAAAIALDRDSAYVVVNDLRGEDIAK